MDDLVLVKHGPKWGLKLRWFKVMVGEELREQYSGKPAVVSIYFVGKSRAKKYNIEYRKMDYVPQVLGFPMDFDVNPDGYVHLGDILICDPLLKEEAILQNKKLDEIAKEWIKHGISNLLKPSSGTVEGLLN